MFISNEIQILYADHRSIHCIRMRVVTQHLRSMAVHACMHACVHTGVRTCMLRMRVCSACVLHVRACVLRSWEHVGSYGNLLRVFCVAGRFFTMFLTLQGVFSQCFLHCRAFFHNVFLHCRAFFHNVFTLQDVFSLRFQTASRFSTVCFRCKSFFVVHFVLCRVFALRILCCVAFSLRLCVLCHVFASCFDTFPEPQPTFPEPRTTLLVPMHTFPEPRTTTIPYILNHEPQQYHIF